MAKMLEIQIGTVIDPGIDKSVKAGDPIVIEETPIAHYFNIVGGKSIPMEINLITGEERERKFPQF